MRLNRVDGIGPSRRPELDQEDQPAAQRQRHEAPPATDPNLLSLSPAPRRGSPGQGRDSAAPHLSVLASGPSSTAEPHTAVHAHAGKPLQGFLSCTFGELPQRGPDESVQMYTQRLLTDHSDLTSRYLNELARKRLSRAPLSDADRRQMTRLLANVNAQPRGANESAAAYEERKRVLYVQVAARVLGTTTRALLEDLVAMAERPAQEGANPQNVVSMTAGARVNTPDTAMPASRPALPVAPQSAAPAGPSGTAQPQSGAPSRPTTVMHHRPHQPAASAGPSGTARVQPGAPSRTNAVAPLSAALINELRHLPARRAGEPNHTYAYRLYGVHGQQFVPLLRRFAGDRLPNNQARVQMALATQLMANQRHSHESQAAYEQRCDMLAVSVAAELLNTTTNALMLELASSIAEAHPNAAGSSVAQRPEAALAIDRTITREALDMLTGMDDEVDLIPQTHPHTLSVIDHLGDIGSLPEQNLHPRVVQAVRTANTATQLVMNLRDVVASHPEVLPTRQQAQRRNQG